MRWAKGAAPLLAVVPVLLAACGSSGGAANTGDPVAVTQAYLDAVKSDPNGGAAFLASETTEKLTPPTNLSKYIADHKASAAIVEVPWQGPGSSAPVPSKKQCLVLPPQGGQICIVTVEVTAPGKPPTYFHVNLETRYVAGKWEIINTDAASKPDEGLPSGNEAHAA